MSTNQATPGQAVNFNVSATDPDGDTLAYSWDFDQVQTFTASGLNSAAATKSWPSAGQYRVVITVSDNGTGIPSPIINKIFQPFFTTKPTGEGTGLGLSMSYDIITKSHGGDLLAKSKEGLGTDFEIVLPM